MSLEEDVIRLVVGELKKRPGATLSSMDHLRPAGYRFLDYDPYHIVADSLTTLMDWGLVDAFDQDGLVSPEQIAETHSNRRSPERRFYISKRAVDIEQAFGIRFDAGGSARVFGRTEDMERRTKCDVFVLMPFSADLRPIYEDHVQPVVSALGLSVARADDFFTNGHIMQEVWTAINQAILILADCTDRNANVFYEVGLAHAIGKETILLAQRIEDIPFDLRHLRVIQYQYNPRGMKAFEDSLSRTIATLRSGAA